MNFLILTWQINSIKLIFKLLFFNLKKKETNIDDGTASNAETSKQSGKRSS